jgi:hypothetical protein
MDLEFIKSRSSDGIASIASQYGTSGFMATFELGDEIVSLRDMRKYA